MSKGVFTFLGGTDTLLRLMIAELRRRGVDCETNCLAQKIIVRQGRVEAVVLNGREVGCRAVISNGSLLRTVTELVGPEHVSVYTLSLEESTPLGRDLRAGRIGLVPPDQ